MMKPLMTIEVMVTIWRLSSLSEEAEEGPKESYESFENDNGPDDDDIIDDEAEVDEGPIVLNINYIMIRTNKEQKHKPRLWARGGVENYPDVVKKDF